MSSLVTAKTNASSTNSTSIGDNTVATSQYAVAIGSNSSSTALSAVSLGPYCVASNNSAIALGSSATSNAYRAISIGNSITNSTANSVLFGVQSNIRANTTTCDLGTTANPFQTLYLNTDIAGPTYSRSADNILSCATNGTVGNLATFTGSAKVIQDSGTALSSLATTASLASYLLLAGGTMTGSINMGTQEITNCSAFRVPGNSILIGDSTTTAPGALGIVIGPSTTVTNSPGLTSVGYGSLLVDSNDSVHLGRGTWFQGAPLSASVGSGATIASTSSVSLGCETKISTLADKSIAIGYRAQAFSLNSISLGADITNMEANSLLIASSSNIRTNSTRCEVGSLGKEFESIFISIF